MSSHRERIYLDNAATTWPKPESVYDAVDHYQREIGAPNGRSGYREALESNRIVERARQGVAELIGADDPLADRLRLQRHRRAEPGDSRRRAAGRPCGDDRLRPQFRAAAAAGAARTGGRRRQLRAVRRRGLRLAGRCAGGTAARTRGSWPSCTRRTSPARFSRSKRSAESSANTDALFLVDAAQSLGHVPLDVSQLGRRSAGRARTQRIARAAGHRRALHSARRRTRTRTAALRRHRHAAATKTASPTSCPTSTSRAITICSASPASRRRASFSREKTIAAIHAHHTALTARLLERLREIDGVTVHGPQSTANRTSVVSITVDGYDPQELAAVLEATHRIQCRAGLHCAPRMHEALGTTAGGGTLRLSPGYRDDARRNRSRCVRA